MGVAEENSKFKRYEEVNNEKPPPGISDTQCFLGNVWENLEKE